MPFMSNFVAVRRDPLRIEGETNDELLAAAERLYVGVRPARSESPELTMYEVPLLSDWSVQGVPERWAGETLTCVGVAILRNGPPFVWTETLDSIGPRRPAPESADPTP